MADMTGTTLANVVRATWSALPTVTYRSNTILEGLMDHRWEPEIQGNIVNVWGFTQNTGASNRGAGTGTFGTGAAITFTANTEAQTQITVDRLYYMADRMAVEKVPQVFPNYLVMLAQGRGQAIALQVDADLAADNTNGIDAATTVVGSDNVDVTEDDLYTCQTNLNNQNAPMEDRFLVVSPASGASLGKIESIRNTLYSAMVGGVSSKLGAGHIGHALGFQVFMSNNLEAGTAGKKNGAFQREFCAFIRQINIQTEQGLNIADGGFRENFTFMTCGFKIMKNAYCNELDGK